MAIAIPVTRAAFTRDLRAPAGRDFIPNNCPSWNRYYTTVVRYYQQVYPKLRKTGLRIEEDVSFSRFRQLLLNQPAVLILFAHWSAQQIEFADGLVPSEEVGAAVTNTFDGFLDLSVCHPLDLVTRLSRDNPHGLTKFSRRAVTPDVWWSIYLLTFHVLQQGPRPYLDALSIGMRTLNETLGV